MREIKLKLTSAKHAALESLRKHLTGEVDADLTPEQKRDRLNYLLQKAGYVRPNTETKQETGALMPTESGRANRTAEAVGT